MDLVVELRIHLVVAGQIRLVAVHQMHSVVDCQMDRSAAVEEHQILAVAVVVEIRQTFHEQS